MSDSEDSKAPVPHRSAQLVEAGVFPAWVGGVGERAKAAQTVDLRDVPQIQEQMGEVVVDIQHVLEQMIVLVIPKVQVVERVARALVSQMAAQWGGGGGGGGGGRQCRRS